MDREFVLPILESFELRERAFTLDGVPYPFLLVMQQADDDLAGEVAHSRMEASVLLPVVPVVLCCVSERWDVCHR